jgi:hypothetical protein
VTHRLCNSLVRKGIQNTIWSVIFELVSLKLHLLLWYCHFWSDCELIPTGNAIWNAKTVRRLYPMTRERSEIESKRQITPRVWFTRAWGYGSSLLANFSVWQARASKNPIFEKFKINISTGHIQTKFSTRKRLNTRSILLLLICGKFRRVQEIFKFFSIWNIECLAKRRVNMRLFQFVLCYYGIWPPVRKVILWGFQRRFRF